MHSLNGFYNCNFVFSLFRLLLHLKDNKHESVHISVICSVQYFCIFLYYFSGPVIQLMHVENHFRKWRILAATSGTFSFLSLPFVFVLHLGVIFKYGGDKFNSGHFNLISFPLDNTFKHRFPHTCPPSTKSTEALNDHELFLEAQAELVSLQLILHILPGIDSMLHGFISVHIIFYALYTCTVFVFQ